MDESQRLRLSTTAFNIFTAFFVGLFFVAVWILASTPNPSNITGCLTTKYRELRLCPTDPEYLHLAHVDDIAIQAILASEDASFYSHRGFDWFELQQSFWLNLSKGGFVRGGSTITQQLAKNVYLTPDKSLLRKLKEALLAAQIERLISKNQILERYINVIELGPQIYGLRQAAKTYFNVRPAELHVLQAAYLTYLLPNPIERYQTFVKGKLSDYARKRILEISQRLYRFKKISASQHLAAVELIDQFPWHDLTSTDIARLRVPTNEAIDVPVVEETTEDEGEPSEIDGEVTTVEPSAPVDDQPFETFPEESANELPLETGGGEISEDQAGEEQIDQVD